MPYKDRERDKKYHAEYLPRWRAANHDKAAAIGRRADEKRHGTPHRKKQLTAVRYRRHHRNKIKVLDMYGTCCAYCGLDIYECLTVDHIHDDGASERKTAAYKRLNCGGSWGYLAKTPFRPDRYQILCANCQFAKAHYHVTPTSGMFLPLTEWRAMAQLRRRPNQVVSLTLSREINAA